MFHLWVVAEMIQTWSKFVASINSQRNEHDTKIENCDHICRSMEKFLKKDPQVHEHTNDNVKHMHTL